MKKNNNDRKKQEKNMLNSTLRSDEEIPSDVLGSYTGVPEEGEIPVQDADDL